MEPNYPIRGLTTEYNLSSSTVTPTSDQLYQLNVAYLDVFYEGPCRGLSGNPGTERRWYLFYPNFHKYCAKNPEPALIHEIILFL